MYSSPRNEGLGLLTLIIAIGCEDGVVVAADSAATDVEARTKQPIEKVKPIAGQPILYGGSGDVGLLQKVDEELHSLDLKATKTIRQIRHKIGESLYPVYMENSKFHVPFPQFPYNVPPFLVLLFAGMHERRPWILEIERDNRDTLYDGAFGDFLAIGGGKDLAQAIFRPHLHNQRKLLAGMVQAYRVVDDSIALAASGLAGPVRMHTISSDGIVKEVDQENLRGLQDTCEEWRRIERESLGKALSPKSAESEPPVPKPHNTL